MWGTVRLCHTTRSFAVRRPDRPGGVVVQPFAPDRLGGAGIVNIHFEVIAERKTEAAGGDVAISGNKRGQFAFGRPASAAVVRRAVINVPPGRVTGIHPGDADVAGTAGGDGGKRIFYASGRQ